MGCQAVRTKRWKSIRYSGLRRMDELYDLEADPHELDNLAKDPGARRVRDCLRDEMSRLLRQSAAPPR